MASRSVNLPLDMSSAGVAEVGKVQFAALSLLATDDQCRKLLPRRTWMSDELYVPQ